MEAPLGRPDPRATVQRPDRLPGDDLKKKGHLLPAILLEASLHGLRIGRKNGGVPEAGWRSPPVELSDFGSYDHGGGLALMYGVAAGRVTDSKCLDFRKSLPDMELGKRIAQSKGGEMLLDPLETVWLESGQ